MTCKKELVIEFLKITSFLQSHMAQQRAEVPIMIVFLYFKGKLLYQDPNRFATLEGGVMPKDRNKVFQMNLDI